MADEKEEPESKIDNRDPLTDAPGSHPLGTGIGSAGGAAAGAASGGAVGGPAGVLVGGAVGAVAGGVTGHAAAEAANPTTEGGAPASKAEEAAPPGQTSGLELL